MADLKVDLLDFILVLGAAQGALLAVLIVHRHGRLYANRFLCALMLSYSVVLLHLVLGEVGIYRLHPRLEFALLATSFLIGPLHYLYAKFLTNKSARLKAGEWLHLSPFLAYLFYRGSGELLTREPPGALAAGNLGQSDIYFNWAIILQGLSYMVLTIVLLRQHGLQIRQAYSALEHVRLDWLRNVTFILLAVLLFFALENVLLLSGINLSGLFNMSSALFAASVYAMGYLGLSRSELFMGADFGVDPTNPVLSHVEGSQAGQAQENKYERSGLSTSLAESYRKRLLQLMESDCLYVDSDLTLSTLADRLAISPHNLSQVINAQLQLNFFDFVNQYRVDKVKRDLSDASKQHLTLLAIGLDAGFNSKSSYNGVFKKHTGLTPSEFKRRLRETEASVNRGEHPDV